MAGILDGYRVIDCTHGQVGPYAAMMLGDLGADVIHVEGPSHPDFVRNDRAMYGVPSMLPHGRGSVFFDDHNRNKRAITLEINSAEGRAIAHQLIRKSDVFVSNFRPKALAKMGLEYRTLHEINPRLIYATASGLGPKGPDADRPTLDLIVNARSGLMMAAGEEGEAPVMLPIGIGDRTAAIFLAYGIVVGLLNREKTGLGMEVHTSQLMSLMTLAGNTLSSFLWLGRAMPRFERKAPRNPMWCYYCCKDGRWIALALRQADRYWPAFCRAMGISHLERDPRFADSSLQAQHNLALRDILADLFASKTSVEWEQRLAQEDLLFSVIQSPQDLVNDPQVIANDYILDWEHPVTGPIRVMGFPVEFRDNPCTLRMAPPAFGEHTEEVLQEVCGFDWDQLVGLRERGVIY